MFDFVDYVKAPLPDRKFSNIGFLVLAFAFVGFPNVSFSQYLVDVPGSSNTLVLHDSSAVFRSGLIKLRPYLHYLPDINGELTFEQITSGEHDHNFKPLGTNMTQWESDTSHYWLKLEVHSELSYDLEWLVNFGYPKVWFYQLKADTTIVKLSGTHVENSSPLLGYSPVPFMPVKVEAGERVVFLAKVAPNYYAYVTHDYCHERQLVLANPVSERHIGKKRLRTWCFLLGVIMTFFLYHFLLYYLNRDTNYIYLNMFLLCLVITALFYNDLAIPLFGIKNGGIAYDLDPLIMCSIVLTYIFYQKFLDYPRHFPRVNFFFNLFNVLILVVTAVFMLKLLFDKEGYMPFMNEHGFFWAGIFPSIPMLFHLIMMVPLYRAKIPNSGIFIFAIGPVLLITFIYVIISNLQIDSLKFNPFAFLVLYLSFTFSYALARNYRLLREQNRAAEIQKARLEKKERFNAEENKRLKELDNAKNRFYANISHEFRTPLTVISGLAETVTGNEEKKKRIVKSSNDLLLLVNQMLELSKIQSGQIKLEKVKADVVAYLSYLTDSFSSLAVQKNISLNFYAEMDELVMDHDPQKLGSIVGNLISNAIKYTPNFGKVMVVAKMEGESQLLIEVRDTGMGIAKEDLPYVFDRFYQTAQTLTKQIEGTGIGLSLVREMTRLMDGTIEVVSEVEKGSSFFIFLPITTEGLPPLRVREQLEIYPTAEHEQAVKNSMHDPAQSASSSENINNRNEQPQLLIIEDNSDVAFYLKSILQNEYQLQHKMDGRAGLDYALNSVPDIIICDIMLPEMNGFEVCETLKNDHRTSHIPLVMLTARADQGDKIMGLKHGADAYMIKPFDREELLVRLRQLLGKQEKMRMFYSQNQHLPKENTKENAFLKKVSQAIDNNLSDPSFGLAELCKEVFLERTQLYRKTKMLTGKSPSELLRYNRLMHARKLLTTTEVPVAEVAYASGFNNVSHFTKTFREYFGETPKSVRS
ncbi:MAG: ATP-binding protein [Bacteroidota bacterium]